MITDNNYKEFLEELSSAASVLGGGGVSGNVGAMGVALGSMIANLTYGTKKYENVQEEIIILLNRSENLRNELLMLAEEDAEGVEPLSKAYDLPEEADEEKRFKEETLERALKAACSRSFKIMQKVIEVIGIHEELAAIGTKIAVSDVGVGVMLYPSCGAQIDPAVLELAKRMDAL